MRYGFLVSTGEPRIVAELAHAAEAHGWDGVFTWDGIAVGDIETHDPWVLIAAMAMRTERIRLGAILTPPARRRPWKLARETATLDRLSGGRLVLPVGLGTLDDQGFANVGEATEARVRAERLDESLEILQGLWTGEPFAFDGHHFRFDAMTFRPPPIQRPRIPIWVAATLASDRSVARALRFDGILPQIADPARIRELATLVAASRREADGPPFEIIVEGTTRPTSTDDLDRVSALAAAGATWWIESDWQGATVESLGERIAGGPPRHPGRPGGPSDL
jgi:alkanesulfonate monooxygenase SsuD/methylene tetrahydromethanopterin reductase-like flavin-dependent oxidoreductase (luciferase family)